jgi:hypothetical protein
MKRLSTLKCRKGDFLYEGDQVKIANKRYVVYLDDGTAVGKPPYWRFKELGSVVGLGPEAVWNYPHTVILVQSENPPLTNGVCREDV